MKLVAVYSFVLIFLISMLTYYIYMFENSRLKHENTMLNINLQQQNKMIQKQKLELENYVCDIDSIKAQALKKYQKEFNQTKNNTT